MRLDHVFAGLHYHMLHLNVVRLRGRIQVLTHLVRNTQLNSCSYIDFTDAIVDAAFEILLARARPAMQHQGHIDPLAYLHQTLDVQPGRSHILPVQVADGHRQSIDARLDHRITVE